jgi:hypothetical protein
MRYDVSIPAAVLSWGADMDLEGNLILERKPARLWVSAVAVILPVLACLAGVTWFIRTFVSPPTIVIASPAIQSSTVPRSMSLAAAPPARTEPPVFNAPVRIEASAAPAAGVEPAPMFAFPPAPSAQPVTTGATAYAHPVRETPPQAAPPPVMREIDAAPIAGPVPLPRPRRQPAVAAAHPAPAAQPRPAEEASAPAQQNQPAYSRHTAE